MTQQHGAKSVVRLWSDIYLRRCLAPASRAKTVVPQRFLLVARSVRKHPSGCSDALPEFTVSSVGRELHLRKGPHTRGRLRPPLGPSPGQ